MPFFPFSFASSMPNTYGSPILWKGGGKGRREGGRKEGRLLVLKKKIEGYDLQSAFYLCDSGTLITITKRPQIIKMLSKATRNHCSDYEGNQVASSFITNEAALP